MLCDVCGKKEAHIHIMEVTPEGKHERNLCEDCADKEGFLEEEDGSPFSFANFLKNILPVAFEEAMESVGNSCPNCGLTRRDMRRIGKFGCPSCYTAFKDNIPGILKIVQGKNESHIGKAPGSQGVLTPKRELSRLKKSLEFAIAEEAYERAAELRDKIADIEREVGKKRAAG
ncbi:MAG: UvrB/UvrC motif-containing protein [Selenomonadaceae bacterium]|nr:UvrB/UvrC motif-containing protein [Selenomonadaceae bacterium]